MSVTPEFCARGGFSFRLAWLVPVIHAFAFLRFRKDVDARDKLGDDTLRARSSDRRSPQRCSLCQRRDRKLPAGCKLNANLPRSRHINVQRVFHHSPVTAAFGARHPAFKAGSCQGMGNGELWGSGRGTSPAAGQFRPAMQDSRRCFDSTSSFRLFRPIRTSAGHRCAKARWREFYRPVR